MNDRVKKMTPAELDLYCELFKHAYAIQLEQTGLVCGADTEALRDKMYEALRKTIYAEPEIEKSKVTTICYGKEKVWDRREDAIQFFLQGMECSEGSERDRYSNIFLKLIEGMDVCTDD